MGDMFMMLQLTGYPDDGRTVLMPSRYVSSRAEKALPIVVICNRATGKVLDHFNGESIQAYNHDETHPYHQWRRVPTSDGFVAYRNVATGMVLDHYGGRSIEAFNDDVTDPHHQWREVDVGDGYVAIQNRATGKVLDHWYGESIRAPNDVVDHVNHQWRVREVRLAATIVVLKNRATGNVLDHYYGESIQAFNDDASHPHHQWHRIDMQSEFVAYLNVATGMALDHYGGRSIQALTADLADPHHQWREVDVGGGFVAIQNRATGKVLDHWYGESIRAPNDVVDHVNHQWRVLEIESHHHQEPSEETEDPISLYDGDTADEMLIILPEVPDEGRGGWWPTFPFPSVDAGANSRRQFSVGGLMHHGIPTIIRLLLQRFGDIARDLASGETSSEIDPVSRGIINNQIDQMYPLFRPMPNSSVQLFAHHDIVLTMVQLLNHYRSSGDALTRLLSRRREDHGDIAWPPLARLLRDNGDNRHESLRSFLARPMAPAIVEAIWNDSHRRRGSERPTLVSLTPDERSRWREFVPLPRSDQFQGLNCDSRNPYRAQTAPLTLWELVVLFFRILEAGVEMDHGVGLSRFSLHYNGILIAPSPESTVDFHDLRVIRDGRLDVLRSRPVDDHTDIGMWHMVTFRDVLATTDPTVQRIDDFSVGFVLHSSDPNAIVVANPGSTRPFTYPPLGDVGRPGIGIHRNAEYTPGPHYHLVTVPGGLDAVESWINRPDVSELTYNHLLGVKMHFFLHPEDVNGLERINLDEFHEDEDDDGHEEL